MLALGLKMSAPMYKTGFQIMIHAPYSNMDNWAFSNVFTWDVWLILGVTSLGVAFMVWGLEYYSKTARAYYDKAKKAKHGHHMTNGRST